MESQFGYAVRSEVIKSELGRITIRVTPMDAGSEDDWTETSWPHSSNAEVIVEQHEEAVQVWFEKNHHVVRGLNPRVVARGLIACGYVMVVAALKEDA